MQKYYTFSKSGEAILERRNLILFLGKDVLFSGKKPHPLAPLQQWRGGINKFDYGVVLIVF